MNERIKELAAKAEGYAEDSDGPFDEAYTEKFAELIVKECVEQIKLTMTRDGRDTKHWQQSRLHIETICKHFGVTE